MSAERQITVEINGREALVESISDVEALVGRLYDKTMRDPNRYNAVAKSEFPDITGLPNLGGKPCGGCESPTVTMYVQLRGHDEPPTKRIICTKGCGFQNYDDGGDD